MADYKIENKKLSIEIFGKVYPVNKPKYREVLAFEDAIKDLSTKEKQAFIEQKLIKSGIPADVLDELDADAFLELIEVIHGTKKNSQ